jgi:hypothetical protein
LLDIRKFIIDSTDSYDILAKENGIVILSTYKTMYNACGILYSNGLIGTAGVSR